MGCTTLLVGKHRTRDGSVLLAHSEDLQRRAPQELFRQEGRTHKKGDAYPLFSGGTLLQPSKTFAYIGSRIFDKKIIPGEHISGINEFQVSVANNMAITRDVPLGFGLVEHGIIWTEFSQLVLERAKTAREGVLLIGDLSERYHLSLDSGTMIAVADPDEGWWVEIARDGQWIAERVPDNGAVMRANCYRIGAVDLDDSANVLHSPDLVEHAVKKGWYDPAGGTPFNFAELYGEPAWRVNEHNTLRQTMVDAMIEKIALFGVRDAALIMRTVYEGSAAYKENKISGSPFRIEGFRTVSILDTEITSIAQLRKNIAPEIGGLMWWNMAVAKTGVYIPWYFATKEFYAPYAKGTPDFSDDCAYWLFKELAHLVDRGYRKVIEKITETWAAFEEESYAGQAACEAQAAALLGDKGVDAMRAYVTAYSNARAKKAFTEARKRIRELKTLVL